MAEHNHNARSPNVTVAGCPGCDQAVAEMSPVERAMRDLRVAADKSRRAWDWHFECLRHLGRRRTGPEAVVLRQSEDDAENSDRELGKAAVRYAAAVTASAPATSAPEHYHDLLDQDLDYLMNNVAGANGFVRPLIIEIRRHRAMLKKLESISASIVLLTSAAGLADVPHVWRELCAIDGALRLQLSAHQLRAPSDAADARCDECDPSFSCFTAPGRCRKRPRSGS